MPASHGLFSFPGGHMSEPISGSDAAAVGGAAAFEAIGGAAAVAGAATALATILMVVMPLPRAQGMGGRPDPDQCGQPLRVAAAIQHFGLAACMESTNGSLALGGVGSPCRFALERGPQGMQVGRDRSIERDLSRQERVELGRQRHVGDILGARRESACSRPISHSSQGQEVTRGVPDVVWRFRTAGAAQDWREDSGADSRLPWWNDARTPPISGLSN